MPTARAARAATLPDSGFGQSRRRLLEALKRRGTATLREAGADVGVSRETAREHLSALGAEGLVVRAGTRRGRPGRPEIEYRLTERAERLFPRRDGELLAELATWLVNRGGEKALRRFFEERAGPRLVAARARLAGLRGRKRLEEVARILSDEGYMAEVADGALRLCHCPLRSVVAVTRIPCRTELALVESLLGRPLKRTDYLPDGGVSCSYRMRGGR